MNTRIYAILFNPPSQQPLHHEVSELIETLPNLNDEWLETCDDVSERGFINVKWAIDGKRNIIKSTVIIKGSKQCHGSNVAWFISGGVPGSMVIDGDVTEEQNTNLI